jgi:adenosylhomocysteine nucleosidase
MQNQKICLIAATLLEAEPFIKIFDMKELERKPFSLYEGKDILLGVAGIGKANAAMSTTYCCMKYQPRYVINTGAAGGVDEGYQVGSIFQIEKAIEPDRPHLRSNTPWVQVPDTLDGFHNAVLATQDRPINDAETFRELSAVADLVDMEGASVLQAARRFSTKCLLFKFVSDTPQHAGKSLIIENIREHVGPFCEFTSETVIPRISEKNCIRSGLKKECPQLLNSSGGNRRKE